MTKRMAGGTKNIDRQFCLAMVRPMIGMVKPMSRYPPSLPTPMAPSWIIPPKMPAKRPRSRRWNQEVLILTMPGAPNACM